MMIEYPFNSIPWDWRMLPFDIIVMLIYAVDTILFQKYDGKPVYGPLDWFGNPGLATGVYLGILAGMIAIFSCILLFTNYVKLPFYRHKEQEKFA